jgi:hypothetical protein
MGWRLYSREEVAKKISLGHAGDGVQRPLVPRSRFPPRLMPGVMRHVQGKFRTFPVK